MSRLVAFNQVTLDGFFTGKNGDFSWAHKDGSDAEWNAFVAGNASGGGMLVFGRITYSMMASYWPSALAAKNDPVVAERMNSMPKLVFSRTLDTAAWSNTTLVKGDIVDEIRQRKSAAGPDMAILGSGSIVSQLAQEGLIDEFQIVVNPVVLGAGRTMFESVTRKLSMMLKTTRVFANGNVVLCYEPLP